MSARTANLILLVALSTLTVIGVVVLTITGHDAAIATVIGVTGGISAVALVGYQGAQNGAKLEEVAKSVNGNTAQLIAAKTQPDVPPVVTASVDDVIRALVQHLGALNPPMPPGTPPQPPGIQSPPGTAQGGY